MRSLAHVVPAALVELLRPAPLSDGKVRFAWRAVVGPAVDRATEVKLEVGILIVQTTSTQWTREIRRSSGMILGRMQEYLGKDTVTAIAVREPRTP